MIHGLPTLMARVGKLSPWDDVSERNSNGLAPFNIGGTREASQPTGTNRRCHQRMRFCSTMAAMKGTRKMACNLNASATPKKRAANAPLPPITLKLLGERKRVK